MPATQRDFPLFLLGLVALPTELVPLHVFEDRYLEMIERCVSERLDFGILWAGEDHLPRSVGCACSVDHIVDGGEERAIDILALGQYPFRLLGRSDGRSYPCGTVEPLLDDPEGTDPLVAQATRELYAELVEQATDSTIADEELSLMDSYQMAGTVDFGADAKQRLLELRSETERMRLLGLLFRAALRKLALSELAQLRARSNGKLHFE